MLVARFEYRAANFGLFCKTASSIGGNMMVSVQLFVF